MLGTECSYRHSRAVFQALIPDRCMCNYWWGHPWNMSGVICIQTISVGIVLLKGFHFFLKSLSDAGRDNLEAAVWNAVTCLSQHEHTVPQSRGVFLWQPAVRYQNSSPCLISLAAKGCCPLKHRSCSSVSIVIPVSQSSWRAVMWAETFSLKIHVEFSVVQINQGRPCLSC